MPSGQVGCTLWKTFLGGNHERRYIPGNRQAEIREFPDSHAGHGEAVVKIRASGLCGTDLHRYRDLEPVHAPPAS